MTKLTPRRRERRLKRQQQALGIANGCLFAIASTLVTCLLLFINGGLVAAICEVTMDSGPIWLTDSRTVQFVLFVGPVCLVVVQWVMIDYVISRMRRLP